MKLPTAIRGKNKIRDSKIISLYTSDAWTMEEIAKRFGISATRVSMIIYRNSDLVKYDKHYEKVKRVTHLKRLLRKHPENIGSKSTLDIIDQVKTEIDGKDGSSDVGRSDTRVIIIRETATPAIQPNRLEAIDGDKDQSGSLPRSLSVVRI
jgi:predicted DNA-binding protein YlxM (UPF0122 family)